MTKGIPVVYLDTSVFVRAIEGAESEAEPLKHFLATLREFPGAAVTRELTWAELPDVIHIVTAFMADCRYIMTPDEDARRLPATQERLYPDSSGISMVLEARCKGSAW